MFTGLVRNFVSLGSATYFEKVTWFFISSLGYKQHTMEIMKPPTSLIYKVKIRVINS